MRSAHDLADLKQIEKCTLAVRDWFLDNDLQLNPSKSEPMSLGTVAQRRIVIGAGSVAVAGTTLQFVDSIWSLGVSVDADLSFDVHVNAACKSCNFHVRALRKIRNSLPLDVAKTVACAIIGSRLDYCNALLTTFQTRAYRGCSEFRITLRA